jgi:NADH-quinone oxidoreductase subunit M
VSFPMLSAIIFLPVVGGIVALVLPRQIVWGWSLAVALVDLVLAVSLGVQFQTGTSAFQFTEHQPWISSLGVNYSLGVDGISLFLVILTALLTAIAIGVSREHAMESQRSHTFYLLMLMLSTGILGVFLATNVFLFYVFWELMLVPAYLLIGIFGGPRRIYAAIKFVIFTAVGSLLMLAAVIGVEVVATGEHSLDFATLVGHVPVDAQMVLFLAFAAAFAVKSPLFPFHSWLPDAYTEAPTPVTVILAGAMSKTGTYGFLRFCLPLFPNAVKQAVPWLGALAVAGILYCAVMALVQSDFKRLLAYSSISHIGVVLLGIFALNMQGAEGAVLQMVNHGITTGALFLIAGFIERRTGTRSIQSLGGMATRVPLLTAAFGIAALSSLGLPGLNSFAGEFLALLGAFRSNMLLGVLGTLVIIPAAWYLLRFFQGVTEGPLKQPERGDSGAGTAKVGLRDLNGIEVTALVPLLALMFIIGFAPAIIPQHIEPSLNHTLLQATTSQAQVLPVSAELSHH